MTAAEHAFPEDPALEPIRRAYDLLEEVGAMLLLASARLEVPTDGSK